MTIRFRSAVAILGALALIVLSSACDSRRDQQPQADTYDVVLSQGRVMDPESGFDDVRNVGVTAGKIVAISELPLGGRVNIDVRGLVVAPGFIDLHAHGQDERSARLQAQDGVTTALDMEAGVFPVEGWYRSREGNAPINFGASASHRAARVKLKDGVDLGHMPTNHDHPELLTGRQAWSHDRATAEEVDRLSELVDEALDDGALGVGVQPEYTPGASRNEIFRIFQLAAKRSAVVFVHARSSGELEPASGLAAVQEVLADAAASGASLHLVHVTSTALRNTPTILDMIAGARQRGIDVSVEAYPYTALSTRLGSALFDEGWQQRLGISYGDLQWSATGERLTLATFEKYRREPGFVVAHAIPEAIADLTIENPLVLIASDGIPFDTGGEHPRGAGTFSRVLGHYVRERGRISLMEGLRKVTLMPAQRLESSVPQMRDKGRLRVGADADITVFDAQRISDRATYDQPMQPSMGVAHVIVGGTFIVRDGQYVEGAFPGQAIRNPARTNGPSSIASATDAHRVCATDLAARDC